MTSHNVETSPQYRVFWRAYLPQIAEAIQGAYALARARARQPDYPREGIPSDPAFWQKIARRLMEQKRDYADAWEQACAQCERYPWPSSLLIQTRVALGEDSSRIPRDPPGLNIVLPVFAKTCADVFSAGGTPDLMQIFSRRQYGFDAVFAWFIGHYFDDPKLSDYHAAEAIRRLMTNHLIFEAYWANHHDLVRSCTNAMMMVPQPIPSVMPYVKTLFIEVLRHLLERTPSVNADGPRRFQDLMDNVREALIAFFQPHFHRHRQFIDLASVLKTHSS